MHEQSTIRVPIVQSEPGSVCAATKFVLLPSLCQLSSLYGILMRKKNQRACPLVFCKSKSYNYISVYTQLRSSVVSNVLHYHRVFLHTLHTILRIFSVLYCTDIHYYCKQLLSRLRHIYYACILQLYVMLACFNFNLIIPIKEHRSAHNTKHDLSFLFCKIGDNCIYIK